MAISIRQRIDSRKSLRQYHTLTYGLILETDMDRLTSAAGILLAATTLIHLFAGEGDVHAPLRALSGDGEMGLYVSVLWHAVTVVLAAMAAALLWATRAPVQRQGVIWLAAAQCAGFAALFIGYGLALAGSLWLAPQWLLFLGATALAGGGIWRAQRAGTGLA
jgi:hypothetical protein